MNNYKIEFPLWIVIDPTPVSEMVDIVWEVRDFAHMEDGFLGRGACNRTLRGRNPVLYTDGIAAHAEAADRLRKRDGKPEWVPLSSLRAGAVFEAQSGWRGVKTADEYIDLGDGRRVKANDDDLVKEIL